MVTSGRRPAVWFGSAYYPEYTRVDRLDADIALMKSAGFTLVRIGESTWGDLEPADGEYNFDRQAHVIDKLHESDIDVLLGTPTYAIPAWLHRHAPQLMAQRIDGTRVSYGGRQNVNLLDETYLAFAERIIVNLVRRFASHPAVVGYQVDNEIGVELLANDDVFIRFKHWLAKRHGDVDSVNARWGLAHWSLRLGSWDELWRPAGNTNPGYDLEWRRFQAEICTQFIDWQRQLVRRYARPDQFVTHCSVGGLGSIRPALDVRGVARVLDVYAVNPYHPTQDALHIPVDAEVAARTPWWLAGDGAWSLYLQGDIAYGVKSAPFLVTELNALSAGASFENFPAYDGQWRQAAYALIARGAASIGYWHFHSLHYGAETYWQGILNHDLEPGRAFANIAQLGRELDSLDATLDGWQPDADVAFLHSRDSDYALSFQPRLSGNDGQGDRNTYAALFTSLYRGYFNASAQARIVYPDQDWVGLPAVLVVPGLYVADDALLQRLIEYASDGGHLILTPTCGYADEHAQVRATRAPGVLREAVGASYQEYSNLDSELLLTVATGEFHMTAGARATMWADGLVEDQGLDVRVDYIHPHFDKFAAITSRPHGLGRVTWVGTVPNEQLAMDLARWSLQITGWTPIWQLPPSVRMSSAMNSAGRRVWALINWSPESVSFAAPRPGRSSTGEQYSVGDDVTQGPYGVTLIVEAE